MGNMGVVLDRFLGPSVMAAIAMAVLFIARGIIVHLLKNPSVRFHAFGETGTGFSVNLKTTDSGPLFVARHHLIKALHKRYAQVGISIPLKNAG